MKALISNLEEYGFEVWILTASPEFLYQRFVASELGIPVTHVLGVKGVVKNGVMSDEIIMPIPQDDGKAQVIPTYIKAVPLIVGERIENCGEPRRCDGERQRRRPDERTYREIVLGKRGSFDRSL